MSDPILANRVMETSATTGTGTLSLLGAVPGYQSFSAGVGDGVVCYYTILRDTEWEVGIGTYTASGSTLSRTTVINSSNANALVSFSAGTKRVFVSIPPQGVGPTGIIIENGPGNLTTIMSSGSLYFANNLNANGYSGNYPRDVVFQHSTHAATPGGSIYANLVQTTVSGFEPRPLYSTLMTTLSPAIGAWQITPFHLPWPLPHHHFHGLFLSYTNTSALLQLSTNSNFSNASTGSRSVAHQMAWSVAYYKRGTGTNWSQIELITNRTWGVSISQSVTVCTQPNPNIFMTHGGTVSYLKGIDLSGVPTLTSSSWSGTHSSTGVCSLATSLVTSHFSSILNILSGNLLCPVGFNSGDLSTPGQYWLGVAWSTSQTTGGTSIGDIYRMVNVANMLMGPNSMSHRQFGLTVTNTSSQFWAGWGSYSASSAAAPGTIQFTQIRSEASHLLRYMNFQYTSFLN